MNYPQYTYNLINDESQNYQSNYICECQCCCSGCKYCSCNCHNSKQSYYERVEQMRSAEKNKYEFDYPLSTRQLYRDKSSIQIKPIEQFERKTQVSSNNTLRNSRSARNLIVKEASHITDNLSIAKEKEEEKVQCDPPKKNKMNNVIEVQSQERIEIIQKEKDNGKTNEENNNKKEKIIVSKKPISVSKTNIKPEEQKQNIPNTFRGKENNQKIKYDLENFNQELLALKRKLIHGKKSIPKYPISSAKISTNNTNSSIDSNIIPKKRYQTLNNLIKKDNGFHYNFPYSRETFNFSISSSLTDKDIMISELNHKVNQLTNELNQCTSLSKKAKNDYDFFENEIKSRDALIKSQNKELSKLNEELIKSKEHIKSLIKRLSLCQDALNKEKKLSRENSKRNSFTTMKLPFTNTQIDKCNDFYIKGIPSLYKTTTKIISSTSISKNKKMLSSSSTSRLINRMNLNPDLSIDTSSIQPKQQLPLSNNLIYKIYNDPKSILCYDISNRSFHLFNYADYNNFEENFSKNTNTNGSIYLTYNSTLYIITGKNNDMFYSYNHSNNSMNKLCSLNNNHRYGALIAYTKSLICLSGSHNKKVELYSIEKNTWSDLPEMNIERSEFCACLLRNRYIISMFGFNGLKSEYLNTVECLDMSNIKSGWRYLKYKNENLISMYIKGHLGINYNDEKIVIVGGVNGEDNCPEENFIQMMVNEDLDELKVEKVERKLKDIYKNTSYMFSCGFTNVEDEKGRKFNVAFDDDNHVHVFNVEKMGHDVFYFE